MGLSQSLYTGWSGLASHQKSMDNLSNNLANINTTGYKKSDYLFSSLFNQAISAGNPTDGIRGSTNPVALGLGVTTGAILGNFSTGPLESTNRTFDLAISGNGFFMVGTGNGGLALTRDGSFYLDNNRTLCLGDGLTVQGWNAQNGVISPSTTVGDITLPAIGDMLPGRKTSLVSLRGILPTNTKSSDFDGNATTEIELAGNLSGDDNSLTTSIFVPVTQTDGAASTASTIQEVKVRIDFVGPTESADGTTNNWTWTMTTVDWPSAGDPGVQIYPTSGDPNFTQGTLSFHAEGSSTYGVGQAVDDTINPGSTRVSTGIEDEEGNIVTSSFTIPSDFSIDISHMTSMSSPAVSGGPSVWHVDGNPTGTMARTITEIFDEYTAFEQVNGIMQAVTKIETRPSTLYFQRTEADDEGSTWTWNSSLGDGSGELRFNTSGELVSSTQTGGGGISYDFSDVQSVNLTGSMQLLSQDGYRDGVLLDFTIDGNGKIWGRYSNDVTDQLAQIAIGSVANPNGLTGTAGTLFYVNPAVSGELMIGIAGDNDGALGLPSIGAGSIMSGFLEGSNVDLGREFTNIINIERGYQFNSRIVSTADEMLQTALQLKR